MDICPAELAKTLIKASIGSDPLDCRNLCRTGFRTYRTEEGWFIRGYFDSCRLISFDAVHAPDGAKVDLEALYGEVRRHREARKEAARRRDLGLRGGKTMGPHEFEWLHRLCWDLIPHARRNPQWGSD